MKYTKSHEWVDIQEGHAILGISEYAQKELGEIVYIELPKVGALLEYDHEFAILESTKSAVDLYAPLTGIVLEVNTALKENPSLINTSPENEGWICKIKPLNLKEIDLLFSKMDYLQSFKK